MDGYKLSRDFFNWSFENPELIKPGHCAIYFFAIEHCNRLGWKEKFGFPTQMAMDAIGVNRHQTYIKYFNDLVGWGFFKLIQKSSNQHSSNIISLKSAIPKNDKALDKATIRHTSKQRSSSSQSTCQSTDSIDKPINQLTKKPINKGRDKHLFENSEFFILEVFEEKISEDEKYHPFDLKFYHEKIKNWSAEGKMKKDWIGTAKNWMLGDLKDGKPKLKTEFEKSFSNGAGKKESLLEFTARTNREAQEFFKQKTS